MMLYSRGSRAGNKISLFKGTVIVISSEPSFKDGRARFNNVEDIDVLLGLKCYISVCFPAVKIEKKSVSKL